MNTHNTHNTQECGGKMYMGERDYDHAIQSFFQVGEGPVSEAMISMPAALACVCLILVRVGSNE